MANPYWVYSDKEMSELRLHQYSIRIWIEGGPHIDKGDWFVQGRLCGSEFWPDGHERWHNVDGPFKTKKEAALALRCVEGMRRVANV